MIRSLSRRPARRRPDDEAGFSLIELLVALLVLALVLVSIAYSLTSALSNVGYSRQQQAATGLANKAIEEVRALPYSTLQAGLNNSDSTITGDTDISSWKFTPTGESLVHSTWSNGSVAPLNPHISSVSVNKTTYKVATYVTFYDGSTSEYRVTSIVTWTPSDRAGASAKVTDQTVIFSPANGCLSPTTHPYAAPCQPYFQATATLGQGYIQIEAPSGYTGDAISGIPLTNAELYLPKADSNIDIEQVANLLGGAYTSGGTIGQQSQSTSSTGQVPGLVQADSDPGSNTAPASAADVAQGGNAIWASSGSSNPNTLEVLPGSSDSGSAVATTAASTALSSSGTAPSCSDLSYPPTAQSSGGPCEDATVVPTGGLSSQMGLYAGSAFLGYANLASVGAPAGGLTDGAFAERFSSAGTSYCTNVNGGDGCVHAGAQRQLGTVTVGGLPPQVVTDAAPGGWSSSTNLFQLANYSDSVSVEGGTGTNSPAYAVSVPAAGQSTPTLTWYNGSGYTSESWPLSETTITTGTVSVSDTKLSVGGTLTVSESATLTVGSSSTNSTGSSPCSSACTLSASVASPIVGDVLYQVSWNGTVLANLDIHIDLGTLSASTTYEEAPSAG